MVPWPLVIIGIIGWVLAVGVWMFASESPL